MRARRPATTARALRAAERAGERARARARGRDHTRDHTSDEGGYVLVFVASTITVVLALVGFSIDMGSWYRRGTHLQTAVDAAALAGAVYLPGDVAAARAAATAQLARNGIVAGRDNVTVTIAPSATASRRLRVCATDTRAASFFASIVNAHPSIGRCAAAEYRPAVAMGGPFNTLDRSSLGLWPAVNGWCTALEEGDLHMSRFRANRPAPGTRTGCPGATAQSNPWYDPAAYRFLVDFPQGTNQTTSIDIWNAAFTPTSSGPDFAMVTRARIDTTIEVWDLAGTPGDPTDDRKVATGTAGTGSRIWQDWRTVYRVKSGLPAGTQFEVRISTAAGQAASAGSNAFALRAVISGNLSRCSSIPGTAGYDPTCPLMHAVDAFSAYADASANPAEFYLASIDASSAGEPMEVTLFDPGEGAERIEILDPLGEPARIEWETVDDHPPLTGSGYALNTSGTTVALPNRTGRSVFNERLILLRVALPDDYATRYGDLTWWKVRYTTSGATVHDRTTWRVHVGGGGAHLVPDVG